MRRAETGAEGTAAEEVNDLTNVEEPTTPFTAMKAAKRESQPWQEKPCGGAKLPGGKGQGGFSFQDKREGGDGTQRGAPLLNLRTSFRARTKPE